MKSESDDRMRSLTLNTSPRELVVSVRGGHAPEMRPWQFSFTMLKNVILLMVLTGCRNEIGRSLMLDEIEATRSLAQEVSADADEPALKRWADSVTSIDVIGIGEATHGSDEIQRAKLQIVRALSAAPLAGVGFEVPAGEALAVDEFVQGKPGDSRQLVAGLRYWVAGTEAMVELVDWLRRFNASRPAADRIHFFGFDTQQPFGAIQTFFNRWLALQPKIAQETLATSSCLQKIVATPLGLGRAQRSAFNGLVDTVFRDGSEVTACFEQCRAATQLAQQVDEKAEPDLAYLATTACQWFGQIRAGTFNGADAQFNYRDSSMASNVVRWRSLHQDRRVVIFGHSFHLAKASGLQAQTLPDFTVKQPAAQLDRRELTQGLWLRTAALRYHAMNVTTAGGTVRAFSTRVGTAPARGVIEANTFQASDGSFEANLKQLSLPRFLLNLKEAPAWLRREMPMLLIPSAFALDDLYSPLTPADEFDSIYFIQSTTASQPIAELEYPLQ